MVERRQVGGDRRRTQRELSEREELFRLMAENALDIVYRYRLLPDPGFEYVSPACYTITGYTPEEHYADPMLGLKLVHPEDQPLLEGWLNGGPVPGGAIILRWVRKDGGVVWTEQRNVGVYDDEGRLVAVEGIARDIGRRKRAQDRLESVLEVTRAHLEQRPTDEVMGLLARQAIKLAMGEQATVTVPSADGEEVVVRVVEGLGADTLRGRSFPMAGTVAGEVMRSRRTVRLVDTVRERGRRPAPEARDIGPALVVPLATANGVLGVLGISRLRGQRPFSDDDVAVAEMFAQQAAVVLEHARLREQLEQLAVLRDRQRIAHELHESVIHSLFGVGISLQVAERVGGADADMVQSRIAQAMGDIDRIIVEVREYIYGLRGQPA